MPKVFQPLLYWGYEQRLARAIKEDGAVPRHLGLILDGNRRFAKELGLKVTDGHKYGAQKLYDVLDWCHEFRVPTVTAWVFSTQNFSRSSDEVDAIMSLFIEETKRMLKDPRIIENRVRIRVIGRKDLFPEHVQKAIQEVEGGTKHHDGLLLQIAFGYGGREEIVDAAKQFMISSKNAGKSLDDAIAEISEDALTANLYTAGVPDPDFIIRTSGEVRLSGFLLWQAAYSEYYFLDVYWPAFRKVDFLRALRSYQDRHRRFGK